MALVGALCLNLNAVLDFTNRSLRAQVSRLLGADYNTNQMSYDLARLPLNGLIERLDDTNRYHLTPDGQRVAIFYTKVHQRLLRARYWPPTNHQHPRIYPRRSPQSIAT